MIKNLFLVLLALICIVCCLQSVYAEESDDIQVNESSDSDSGIGTLDGKCKELRIAGVIDDFEFIQFQDLLKRCKLGFEDYVLCANTVLANSKNLDGAMTFSRVNTIKGVEKNFNCYIDFIEDFIIAGNFIMLGRGQSEVDATENVKKYMQFIQELICEHKLDDLEKVLGKMRERLFSLRELLREKTHVHEVLKCELDEKLKRIQDVVQSKVSQTKGCDSSMPSEDIETCLEDMKSSSMHLSEALSSTSELLKSVEKVISDEEVINRLFELMKTPNECNVLGIVDLFYRVNEKHKMNIFRHLVCLSNFGNEFATNALETLRPQIPKEKCPKENILIGDVDDSTKIKLFEEKKKLDGEYANSMIELFMEYFFDEECCAGCSEEEARKIYSRFFKESKDMGEYEVLHNSLSMRRDMVFFLKRVNFWFEFGYSRIVDRGWKIHVSAQPNSALKIAKIAIPILHSHKVDGKICSSLDALRHLNFLPIVDSRAATQAGKFITVYPANEKAANEIAKDLDKAFVGAMARGEIHPYDFCELSGDAMLGRSGAVYVRYGGFTKKIRENRNIPLLPLPSKGFGADKVVSASRGGCAIPMKSPFEHLEIRFLNKVLNPEDCTTWARDTRELQNLLILNEYRRRYAIKCRPQDSIKGW